MSKETAKATRRRIKSPLFMQTVFKGDGIDIGCGNDALDPNIFVKVDSVVPFDLTNGQNANNLLDYHKPNTFDFVYSSQCLEHLEDPYKSFNDFVTITKPGGYVVITVPDEELYEKSKWPSKFSNDHKFSFSILNPHSKLPRHIDVFHMLLTNRNIKIIKVELIDTNYDYTLPSNIDQTLGHAEAFIEFVVQKL